MRLIDAPIIVRRFGGDLPWISAAARRIRELHVDPPKENRQGVDQTEFLLKQLAEDIWSVEGPLGIHTDKTRRGFRVIGVVLINEPGLVLVQGDRCHPLPVGTVYHIDGRAPHGAVLPARDLCNKPHGLFGFMAWDVHRSEDIEELVDSIPESMQAFADGEERIDVSTAVRDL